MPKLVRKFVRNSSLSLMSLVISALIVFGCLYFYMAISLPDVEQLKDIHLQIPLRIYTSDGKLIGEFGEKKRIPVSIGQVPKKLVQAVIDTEDQRFYEHKGVDFIGLVRATISMVSTGKVTQGASTITMQVARNFFLSPDKTFMRKINEILLAFKIDRTFSKDEILNLYFNKIYLGQRAYGFAAAALVYYGKTLDQLTLPEMASIAGLPQAPSRDNPVSNPAAALERRNHVLQRMFESGHITKAEYEEAIATPLNINYNSQGSEIEAPYVAEMARNAMVERFGDEAYDIGFKVYTTIDSKLQQVANKALKNGIYAYDERHGYRGPEKRLGNAEDPQEWLKKLANIPPYNGLLPAVFAKVKDNSILAVLSDGQVITIPKAGFSWVHSNLNLRAGDVIRVRKTNDGEWHFSQVPKVEGALVALNPENGAVIALDGGFSYAKSSFNRVIQANRQPGSSFKPFIYSAALAKGYTLASVFNDSPVVITVPGTNAVWRPQNDTSRFYGPTRLRVALTESFNLVSVRLLQAIGVSYGAEYVKRFGFDSSEIPVAPSLALGTASLTPMKMAVGFAAFANGGYRITPYFIFEIKDQKDQTIFKTNPPTVVEGYNYTIVPSGAPVPERVITAQNAYLITNALKDVIKFGTARKAASLHRDDLAGKTGTTNEQVDGWFSGYNADLVTTVWIGFDQPESIHEHGAVAALPVWMDFMQEALHGKPEHSIPEPPGITSVRIDPATGLLAHSGQEDAIFELFTTDTVPTTESPEDGSSGDGEGENGDSNDNGAANGSGDDGGQLF